MKIMKVKDKKIEGSNDYYVKYRINLPKKIVEESGLTDKEIEVKLKGKKIVIERK